MDDSSSIFDYIESQENAYKQGITLPGGWKWSMKDHLELSYLYTNSQLKTGKDDFKPVKNITRPILNLQHRTEDIEVKDVQIYVNDSENYHLSFLVKKFHDDVFVQKYDLDTYFDELNVSRIDIGGGLSKSLNHPCPEVVPLHSIAFCDQTDMLSGPIGLEHYYSPDQLLAMRDKGWGKEANGATITIDTLLPLLTTGKELDENDTKSQTPGRYAKIYEVHGNLPKKFADPNDTSGEYAMQIFICGFYQKKGENKPTGVILYTKPEDEMPFKLIKRDPVWGRALGFGGAEELFEDQVWTNYDMIRIQNMLDAAAVTVLKTTDPAVAHRNNLKGMSNLEIVEMAVGTDLSQVDTFPRNVTLFERSIAQWDAHAKEMGGATEALQGENPSAGTPFRLQSQVIAQGLGLHEYRRGQFAKHLEEVYKDWIIPYIEKEICKGTTFLSELSLEELQYVTDAIVSNEVNTFVKEKILNGELVDPQAVEAFKVATTAEIKKRGNKHFVEILKGEFKNKPLSVKVSVKGKSKDLGARTDNLVNVFRQIIANPAVLTIPAISKIFNDILESSGFSPADFTGITTEQLQAAQPQQSNPASGTQSPVVSPAMTQPGYTAQPQNA